LSCSAHLGLLRHPTTKRRRKEDTRGRGRRLAARRVCCRRALTIRQPTDGRWVGHRRAWLWLFQWMDGSLVDVVMATMVTERNASGGAASLWIISRGDEMMSGNQSGSHLLISLSPYLLHLSSLFPVAAVSGSTPGDLVSLQQRVKISSDTARVENGTMSGRLRTMRLIIDLFILGTAGAAFISRHLATGLLARRSPRHVTARRTLHVRATRQNRNVAPADCPVVSLLAAG